MRFTDDDNVVSELCEGVCDDDGGSWDCVGVGVPVGGGVFVSVRSAEREFDPLRLC